MRRKKRFFQRISLLGAVALLMSSMAILPAYASQDAPDTESIAENTENAYVDWNWVLYELSTGRQEDLAKGEKTVDLITGMDTVVPSAVVNESVNQRITLAFHTGTGICFSVDGNRIKPTGEELNLIVKESVTIPEALLTELGQHGTIGKKLHLEAADFPVEMTLHVAMGSENAGKYANLYHYDVAMNQLVCVGSFRIVENGQAAFDITRGGEYVVIVSDKAVTARHEAALIAEHDYMVKKGDNLSKIAHKHAVTLKELLECNPQIKNPNKIFVGQRIILQK